MDMREELEAINRFAKTPLTAEQVYVFPVRLCDNEVDRDFERFDTAALERLGELFLGKSGIFDHQWSALGQTARIYRTEMVRDPARVTAAGAALPYGGAQTDPFTIRRGRRPRRPAGGRMGPPLR